MELENILKAKKERFSPPTPNFKDSSILITGAGGSIGSELSRQILLKKPKNLYILDSSEISLFEILNNLTEIKVSRKIKTKVSPILVNLCEKNILEDYFENVRLDFIYHSAAYKHVNLVEENNFSALKNNLLSTKNLLDIAVKKSQNFLLISTDKAVHPINFMGFSKKLCEVMVNDFAKKNIACNFNIVRFGNVLHSSGSVIPIFEKQIEENKSITVTDKNATRFFMTIPEAVSLVIGSSSLKSNGKKYVLDMGRPVKILDLALQMIKISGFSPCFGKPSPGEIQIKFIGIRKGEKIHESLTSGSLKKTSIDGIHLVEEKIEKLQINKIIDLLKKKLTKESKERILKLIMNAKT